MTATLDSTATSPDAAWHRRGEQGDFSLSARLASLLSAQFSQVVSVSLCPAGGPLPSFFTTSKDTDFTPTAQVETSWRTGPGSGPHRSAFPTARRPGAAPARGKSAARLATCVPQPPYPSPGGRSSALSPWVPPMEARPTRFLPALNPGRPRSTSTTGAHPSDTRHGDVHGKRGPRGAQETLPHGIAKPPESRDKDPLPPGSRTPHGAAVTAES